MNSNWIVNHLGARAHYEIAKAIHENNRLKKLYTDVWISNHSLHKYIPSEGKKFFQRFNKAIPNEKVKSYNLQTVAFELNQKLKRKHGWEQIIDRNDWYQNLVVRSLNNDKGLDSHDLFFSFSYTALKPFQFFEKLGNKRVMYQMDPGLPEEDVVAAEYEKFPEIVSNWQRAPEKYWSDWNKECELSDGILVNSQWSLECLLQFGVAKEKIKVIPLPLTIPTEAYEFKRTYPSAFSLNRPLRVLFLGTLTVRKGFHRLLKVCELLQNEPIEFIIVGQKEFEFPAYKNMKIFDHVSRDQTNFFYQNSDVFIFPTLSDGFGLTQLEAMSWKLPVISSRYCGEVVRDGVNGLILHENSVEEVSEVLLRLSKAPELLSEYSKSCLLTVEEYDINSFGSKLVSAF